MNAITAPTPMTATTIAAIKTPMRPDRGGLATGVPICIGASGLGGGVGGGSIERAWTLAHPDATRSVCLLR